MDFIIENGSNFIEIALQIAGIFAIIASMTPNENDNKVADYILKFINFVGFNVGNARNA
tara:strand:+ start:1522 stop:1698 length:177 start_codon:yes stop_codon:yes gene_type:complete